MSTVKSDTSFPNYEVIKELGGRDARSFKAQHLPTGDLVFIKEYVLAKDEDTLRRFDSESQQITRINNPNLVRVREVNQTPSMVYMVMDYVEGTDLRSLIQEEGFLDIATTTRLGLQLTSAFRALHAHHISHRAITPDSILCNRLVSGELHVLLTDFGIANTWTWTDGTGRTLTDQSLVNYEYAAPEQFGDPHQVDEAVDYYALGVILYECLTGKVPFKLDTESSLPQFKQLVLTGPIPPMVTASGQALPPSLATLLMGLLVRNPQDRLRNVDQMELLLEQSRVEQLNATWTNPAPLSAKPLEEPVVAEGRVLADAVPAEETPVSGNSKNRWVLISLVLVAIAAFFVYKRPAHEPAAGSDSYPMSETQKATGRTNSRAKSAYAAPVEGEENRRVKGENNMQADSVRDTNSAIDSPKSNDDSGDTKLMIDSTGVSEPDSTE